MLRGVACIVYALVALIAVVPSDAGYAVQNGAASHTHTNAGSKKLMRSNAEEKELAMDAPPAPPPAPPQFPQDPPQVQPIEHSIVIADSSNDPKREAADEMSVPVPPPPPH
eukprot:TRINITY_DN412_c1_g1_i1.p2 TRINITY_DN412_c1_g1~~TRINITY_DN412_c1_g1_i1.p2  ORF type:complete len:111 (-),score=25.79 TRINITY_DN412_c1_g1_i1:31-363(-)